MKDMNPTPIDVFTVFKEYFDEKTTVKVIFSKTKKAQKKIIIKPVLIKKKAKWVIETFYKDQVFHSNQNVEDLLETIRLDIISNYKHITIINTLQTIQLLVSKKNDILIRENENLEKTQNMNHNKEKKYIFNEGDDIAPLRDLGIFTENNLLVKSKYNKFKQINRFIEIINDEFKDLCKDNITILDFGCGKSYLTFLVYYYFKFIKKYNVSIKGYDQKYNVINECNEIAEKYGYTGMNYFFTDITSEHKMIFDADIVISLHACDIITDFALYHAIKNNIPYIFCVPCCQHEIKSTIQTIDELKFLLLDGLFKERFSALLTDAIRCEILRQNGYIVDVIEFVDIEHTTKNLMIRAVRNSTGKHHTLNNPMDQKKRESIRPTYANIESILKKFNTTQKLFSLLKE